MIVTHRYGAVYKNIDRRCLREALKDEVEVLNAIIRIDRSQKGNEKGRHQQQAAAVAFVALTRRRNNVGQGPFGCIRCVFRARSSTSNTTVLFTYTTYQNCNAPRPYSNRLCDVIIVIE